MRAIPKKLLIHKGELLEEAKGDWGPADPIHLANLEKIRVESSNKIISDKNNVELRLEALMFFDCKNSRPSGQTFQEDQIYDFNGQKYRIVSVELLQDEDKPHHYEIGMVRYAG